LIYLFFIKYQSINVYAFLIKIFLKTLFIAD
jgi:hypothetical protein